MRENLEITELYEKWIKQDGDDTPPKCSQNDEEATQAGLGNLSTKNRLRDRFSGSKS